MIIPLQGPDCGVAKNEHHALVEWNDGEHRVVFSACRQGNALNAHFACGSDSLRQVRPAINDFIEWACEACPWCEFIIAQVGRKSVERLLPKLGFLHLITVPQGEIFYKEVAK